MNFKKMSSKSLALIFFAQQLFAEVKTYDIPGGADLKSPDYSVTIANDGKSHESFVTYSYALDKYPQWDEYGNMVKEVSMDHKGPQRHSHSIFSFDTPVTVKVTIHKDAKHITLPLKSAKVLPSSYNIPCHIENGNTIVFKLNRPEKVAIIPNYDQVWEKFVEMGQSHMPVKSWEQTIGESEKGNKKNITRYMDSLAEGYDNPLIVSALPLETEIPDGKMQKVLSVKPGDKITEKQMLEYDVVWFKPGLHDLSTMGRDPYFHTRIKRGQTVYLEGGSYLYARFMSYHDKEAGPITIMGRGIISGLKHSWIHSFSQASLLNNIDRVIGVTITERASFSIYNSRLIKDVTLLGAWHGNNDGPDYSDDTLLENCFMLAHDDNLKLNNNTHAKHIVIWQGTNAHSIMVKETFRSIPEFANSVVEDVDIITYFQDPSRRTEDWARHGMGAIACVTAMPIAINNFTFKNIRIESPYLYRIFNITNLNSSKINPGWFMKTTDEKHSRINGMHFENISITTPLIGYRSKIWSDYDNSLKNITFKNITVNGVLITDDNKNDFFEIQENRGQEVTFLNP